MIAHLLRPLTLTALATLLVTLPSTETWTTPVSMPSEAAPAPALTTFPTSGLTNGAKPAISYAFAAHPDFRGGGWRLHRTDGTSLKLPRLTWGEWAPMGSGAIGMAGTEAGPELQRVAGDGHVSSSFVLHYGLAVTGDHRIVGWLGDHGAPHVVEGGGSRHVALPRVAGGESIDAISGVSTCQEQAPEGGGCSVFVGTTHPDRAWVTTSHGIVARVDPMLRVTDVNGRGRVTGLSSRATSTSPSCWGVWKPSGHRVFRTCDYALASFAPGGRRILGERVRNRWSSVKRFAILGRDGHVVQARTFDPGRHQTLSRLTWEDSHHLLGVLFAHGAWSIVRIGIDGTVQRATTRVTLPADFSPYSLPMR